MIERLRRSPRASLAVLALLTAAIVQPGEMASKDTLIRLQTTHSYWTSSPAVAPEDYPQYGLIGRDGKLYAWWGMAQSVLMLPADVAVTLAMRAIPRLAPQADIAHASLRVLVVSMSLSIPICVAGVLATFGFLRRLEFTQSEAMGGALALLFGTQFLHYTQNAQENNLMLLLTVLGFSLQHAWFRSGEQRYLVYGALAFAVNLLVRLPAAMDAASCGLLLLVLAWRERSPPEVWRLTVRYLQTVTPIYAIAGLLDRLYHFSRFAVWTGTYIGIQGRQHILRDPSLPPNYPFSTPFLEGFWGAFASPEKGVLLLEPLTVLFALLCLFQWRNFAHHIRTLCGILLLLLLGYVSFHATYFGWGGDDAWGDRFITTPVEMLGALGAALLVRSWHALSFPRRAVLAVLAAAALLMQLLSVVFWFVLECNQYHAWKKPVFVPGLRVMNIVAVATRNMDAWGLRVRTNGLPHTETPYFFPFLAKAERLVSPGRANAMIAAWWLLVGAALLLLWSILRRHVVGRAAAP